MKAAHLFLFSYLVAATLAHSQDKATSWKSVQQNKNGELSILIYPQPGIIEVDDNGRLSGLGADILKDFCSFVKLKYEYDVSLKINGIEQDFKKFLQTTKEKSNVIAVSNITITKERLNGFKFTPPYLKNPIVFVTQRDCNLTTMEELKANAKEYSAIAVKGSTHEEYLRQFKAAHAPDLNIRYSASGKEVLEEVATNAKLFTVVDITEYMDAIRKKMPLRTQKINITHNVEQLAFAMNRASDWDKVWNEFLTEKYIASAEFKKHILANLGDPYYRLVYSAPKSR